MIKEKNIDLEKLSEEELLKLISETTKEVNEEIDSLDVNKYSLDDYLIECKKIREDLEKYEWFLRLKKKSYELSKIPKYGDHMRINIFIDCINDGIFIDDDGHGYYATKDKMSDIRVIPSEINKNDYIKEFTHVVWFNS